MATKRVQLTITDQRFFDDAQNKREAVRVWSLPWKLPYWIEKWDAQNGRARVWVKVPKIPANSSVDLYIYYGNPVAQSESDGKVVFEFFDDFEDGDISDWAGTAYLGTTAYEGSYSIKMVDTSTSERYNARKDANLNMDKYYFVTYGYVESGGNYRTVVGLYNLDGNIIAQAGFGDDGVSRLRADGGAGLIRGPNYSKQKWYKFEIWGDSSKWNLRVYDDVGNLVWEVTDISYQNTYNGIGGIELSTGALETVTAHFDSMIICKYADQDPIVTVGEEEESDVPGWLYRRKITIHNPNDYDLHHFQVAIDLDGSNFDFTKANADGSDIRITYASARYSLPYYIETWDTSTPQAVIWVGIDSETRFFVELDPNNTTDESDPTVMDLPEATNYTLAKFERYVGGG